MRYIIRLATASIVVFILLSGCTNTQQQPSDTTEAAFRTTSPSLLYFKNMRSIYYNMEEQEGSRIERYQLKQFAKDTKRPIIYPVIANNWLNDEAYLMLKTNGFIHGFAQPLQIKIIEQDTLLTLASSTNKGQYLMATGIYEALKAGYTLEVTGEDRTTYPLFDDKLDKSHYMMTLRDYLRLIEAN